VVEVLKTILKSLHEGSWSKGKEASNMSKEREVLLSIEKKRIPKSRRVLFQDEDEEG
jgi:hypothetical protein